MCMRIRIRKREILILRLPNYQHPPAEPAAPAERKRLPDSNQSLYQSGQSVAYKGVTSGLTSKQEGKSPQKLVMSSSSSSSSLRPSAAMATSYLGIGPIYQYTIKSLVKGVTDPVQAPLDLFSSKGLLPFPETKASENSRDVEPWIPYVEALGLETGKYNAIQVEGRRTQSQKIPSWNFLHYTVLALAPGGKMKLNPLFLPYLPGLVS